MSFLPPYIHVQSSPVAKHGCRHHASKHRQGPTTTCHSYIRTYTYTAARLHTSTHIRAVKHTQGHSQHVILTSVHTSAQQSSSKTWLQAPRTKAHTQTYTASQAHTDMSQHIVLTSAHTYSKQSSSKTWLQAPRTQAHTMPVGSGYPCLHVQE